MSRRELSPEEAGWRGEVVARLLRWYGAEGRELPWRGTRDPYRVWLSEIMLQQTTVAAVIPYYERFLEAFPAVEDLAAAPIESVVELWAGLGYYSRARNLHAAAQVVVRERGGRFPDTLEGLMELPGVGRSTAGAILSIAFDRPAPILDGNVRRVLVRLIALREDPRSAGAERILWRLAGELTPADRSHDYAQAIMDLGATVCLPRRPECLRCPLELLCEARRQGDQEALPIRVARRKIPTVVQVALLAGRDGKVLIRRRPLEGMLGGLWELPAAEVLAGEEPEVAARRCLADFAPEGEVFPLGSVNHAYSHFRVELHLFRAPLAEESFLREGEFQMVEEGTLADIALHGAHRRAVRTLVSAL